jgi:ubiquinone biosynthesis protein
MSGLARLAQISLAATAYLVWWTLVRLGLWRPPLTPAQRLRGTLERLGTTFVKLGQGLSLRPDLLPEGYIVALQVLQDRVAPFPGDLATREVEQALGRPLGELFAEFDRAPLAAASIAQVHKAVLRDGRRVVVKVRRPGIRAQVDQDIVC